MAQRVRVNLVPDAIQDPFKHAAYADQIEDNIALKKLHYLKAINLYKNGCISDWHIKYVDCLISLGQLRSAYNHVGHYHQNVRGWTNLILRKAANYHFQQKRYFIAVQLYKQINNNMIWRKGLNFKIGICYKHLHKYKESLKHLKRYLRQQGEDKKNIITYIHLADVYEQKLKYKKALDIYNTKLTQKDIETHQLFTKIGVCYFKINDFEKSLFYFNKQPISEDINVTKQQKININVCRFYKGYIYSRKCEMFDDALKCFKCIDCKILPSKHGSIDNELGYVYFKLKEFDLSLKYYKNDTKNNKNKYFALVSIAIIYSEKGNYRQALKYYKSIHSMIKKSELLTTSQKNDLMHNKLRLSYNVGICCYNSGEYKLSLKNLLAALKWVKKDKICIDYWIKISFIYHKKLHKYNKANKYYVKLDKLKEINKQNMELLYAHCLQKSRKYDDAFKMIQRYLHTYPNSIHGLNTLVTLNIIGKLKYDSYCDELIQKSLDIDPNIFHTNYIYAFHLYIIRNKYQLSKRYLNIAQSFINNRHEIDVDNLGIVVDIAKLYTVIDVDSVSNNKGELKSFDTIGMHYFEQILTQFTDISELNMLYSHFLCRFKKFKQLDMFHVKCMNEFRLFVDGNMYGLQEYAFDLHKIGRINFAIEIVNKIEHKKSKHFKNLAILYEIKKDYCESLLYLKKCCKQSTDFETIALWANVLFKMGQTVEAIDKFKIAFNEMNENGNKDKYLDMNFVISYVNAMYISNNYTNCIEELLKILNNNNLSKHDIIFIHQLLVELYGKINYNWDNDVILKHLKVIYETNKRVIKDIVCCTLI